MLEFLKTLGRKADDESATPADEKNESSSSEEENTSPEISSEEDQSTDVEEKKVEEEIKETPEATMEEGDNKKEEKPTMTGTADCAPKEKGYLTIDIPKVPRASTFYYTESCCCEDEASAILEALYQFVLLKKAANPAILKVSKKFSPNGACNALQVDWNLLNLSAATEADMHDIWIKYILLLAA